MKSPMPVLAVVAGGVLLGVTLGQMAHPEMKFREGHDWRSRLAPTYSTESMQFVDAGPDDLSPTWYGPSYHGPGYLPAIFAEDLDMVPYGELPGENYAFEEDLYSGEHLHSMPADVGLASAVPDEPAVPPAVERASEEAAKVAAELMEMPVPNGSASPSRGRGGSGGRGASLR